MPMASYRLQNQQDTISPVIKIEQNETVVQERRKQECRFLRLVHSSVTGWKMCLVDFSNIPEL